MIPVFLLQVMGGALLLANRFVPIALTLLGPVIVNILLYHTLMDPAGLPPGLVALALWLVVFYSARSAFRGRVRHAGGESKCRSELIAFAAAPPTEGADAAVGASEALGQLIERIEHADQVGLDVFGIGEHHRQEFLDSAPPVHTCGGGGANAADSAHQRRDRPERR